ncbi:indole-3-glycerol phosphate synthase TrpC [Candidatus Methylacidiphilum infernorum]|uniref:Indole-3-glycerol phosphate synthase n=1 Tax=Candidatus Methylacidiphilum infernorum TaxID=511746 RepID=A0ABX7PXB9_9BACT|nr:indole-3-glycerol phosphate synthase TrpC [Candidatus Methylacidiphilum infernorum]QSR87475.1 indole-3-glycerol phosphate synthase TrpC [Candidatus Methylacidiphilum infernorum]
MKESLNWVEEVIAAKKEEIKKLMPQRAKMEKALYDSSIPKRAFAAALRHKKKMGLIAEFKRNSPSAGVISSSQDLKLQVSKYQQGGADCISVLTENKFFKGSLEDLKKAREAVTLPILRKDFIIHELQVIESLLGGADALLLIVAILPVREFFKLYAFCKELGIEALVEVHNEAEIDRALEAGASLIGINNRDLYTLQVDLRVSRGLLPFIPEETIVVSESGISSSDDLCDLRVRGADAVLVGEFLMKQDNPQKAIADLLSRSYLPRGTRKSTFFKETFGYP